MTKEITKANILQEMQDKFKLRDLIPEKFTFEESVVPVYNIEQHLKRWENLMVSVSITGTGGKVIYNVPDDEVWEINGYTLVPMGAGAYTFSGVYYTRKGATTYFIYLDLTAGQTVSYTHYLSKPLNIFPGDRIGVNIDGYTSTQDLRLYVDVMKETIR